MIARLASAQWRGTYGVLALCVAFSAGLLAYHRIRREGSHNQELVRVLQEALYQAEVDPAHAASRLEEAARASPSKATPWILQTLGAAHARLARSAGAGPEARDAYLKAIAAYERLIHEYPRHLATPLAMLAVGQLHEDLGGGDLAAAEVYGRLVVRYPESAAAKLFWAKLNLDPEKVREKLREQESEKDEAEVIREVLLKRRRRMQMELTALARKEETQAKPPETQKPETPQ